MTPEQIERYKRHILVKEIGGPGQNKLLSARVDIVGAGALGGQAALSLAASGIGHLRIFDDDRVDVSNLQRQIQFSTEDVGKLKVEALKARLLAINPGIELEIVPERWSEDAAAPDCDVLLDGCDNFETRYQLNAWSLAQKKPLVSGAVASWQGQAVLLNTPDVEGAPCYQCFVPEKPPQAGDCNDLGVVGAVTSMTAAQMVLLTMRYLLGLKPEPGALWLMDALNGRSRSVKLIRDPVCPACGNS